MKLSPLLPLVVCSILLVGCGTEYKETPTLDHTVTGEAMMHMDHSGDTASSTGVKDSPRHQERVEIDNNGKTIHARVVYPEVNAPAPVVLVIHENKGLNDWARQMADDIAAQGYIAIAPDLLSSYSDEYKKTSDFASDDAATKALYTLQPDNVMADLKAVEAYADTIQASNGKIVSAGFCWGGSQSFRYATASTGLDHAFVFYGSAPEDGSIFATITAPVTAYYGGDDARINTTIPQTEEFMKQFDKQFTYEIYSGAGHAFMRNAVSPDASEPNKEAREKAFADMIEVLQGLK